MCPQRRDFVLHFFVGPSECLRAKVPSQLTVDANVVYGLGGGITPLDGGIGSSLKKGRESRGLF